MRPQLVIVLIAVALVALVVGVGCASNPGSTDATTAPNLPDVGGPGAHDGNDEAGSAPTKTPGASDGGTTDADASTTATYRTSLSVCWTDAKCPRAMSIAHGGDWSPTTVPYGSMGAVALAYAHGVDGVKIDVRVTKDHIPVISHSSPIEAYESLDCYGKKIEEMTAAEVTSCHFVQKASESFQRLDAMLGYLRGKMVVQLCVKTPVDYATAIAEVIAQKAQDFAFLEVSTSDLQTVLPPIAGSNQVFYLVNIGSALTEVDLLLGTIKNPRAFMFEMDPSAQISAIVTTKLHPANVRAFTYDSSATASVAELTALFDQGFDVVSANATPNDSAARIAVNKARSVSPP